MFKRLPSPAALLTAVAFFLALSLSVPVQTAHANANDIRINIQEGDIRDFIKWIAGSTQKNFIIDPRVKGKVTVMSNESMSPDEAYQVLLSVLQVHGFAAVENDGVVKIVPDTIARNSPVPVTDGRSDSTDEMVVQVLKPKHIGASKLLAILRPLVPQSGHLAAYPDSNALIVADRAANIAKLAGIIKRIDQASEQSIELIELRYAGAQEVANILQAMLPQKAAKTGQALQFNLAVDERTNSILLSGEVGSRKRIAEIINVLDQPDEREGNTRVFYLHYLKSSEMADILKGMVENIKKGSKDDSIANAIIAIHPSETTNALVITAPPRVMETMQGVIKKLDIRRAQVLVEAIIVEVKDDQSSALGVQWNTNSSKGDGGSFVTRDGSTSFSQAGQGIFGGGLSLGYYQGGSLEVLIKAMAGNSSFNILSTPTLVTLDNEEAKIVVGQNVPFVTGTTSGSSTGNNPFQTIERQDVGTKLSVTPRINGGDAITLKVEQEISSLNQSSRTQTGASDVVTDTRSISTSVLIRDSDVLVLGGLITDEVTQSQSKVPLLGDIPVLGALFTNKSSSVAKRNLMVFIKPTILKDYDRATSISQGRYRFVQELQTQFGKDLKKQNRLDGPLPVLPDVEALNPEQPISFGNKSLPEQKQELKSSEKTEEKAAPDASTEKPVLKAPVSKASPSAATQYLLQAGSFRRASVAGKLKAQLLAVGQTTRIEKVTLDTGQSWHRVQLGPFENRESLEKARTVLKGLNIEGLLLKVKKSESQKNQFAASKTKSSKEKV